MNSTNWWANKMTGQPSMPAPAPTPQYPPQTPYNPAPQQPLPTQQPLQTHQPRQAMFCPGCGSGNYGSVTPESKARCYDCGYPIQQSGSGVGTGIPQQGGGPATPARQISTQNNYNPQGIIGHI
jgi:hypothetical protein